jgi:hypothetical protein
MDISGHFTSKCMADTITDGNHITPKLNMLEQFIK